MVCEVHFGVGCFAYRLCEFLSFCDLLFLLFIVASVFSFCLKLSLFCLLTHYYFAPKFAKMYWFQLKAV